jgi:hypothetical protein
MKANELRIGNYIKLMFNHEDYETLQVTLNDLVSVDKKQAVYEPILLTEEWLLSFGLKKIITINEIHYEIGGIVTYILDYHFLSKNGYVFNTKSIKYVHQLQNVCFDLFDIELTLKETP